MKNLPANKISDFSLHLFPSTNLLKELKEKMLIDVIILACQVERIPNAVSPGLSNGVKQALPEASKKALKLAEKAPKKNDCK
jgi:coenzyme F420 hydrogenase subunit delta